MPWILLTKKLPVNPSPPKLSIFWATPWPMDRDRIKRQQEKYVYENGDENEEVFYSEVGAEHNAKLGLRIHYKDCDIRVWAAECSVLDTKRMRDYVFGMPGEEIASHELVANTESDAALLRMALETDLRGIYDAALIDGCSPQMALAVTMGMEITDKEIEFPQVGWYRCKREFAEMFCDEWEMAEDVLSMDA